MTTGGTILIIDDDAVTLETYATMLRLEGYAIRTATTLATAWEAWNTGRPDAIILDLRLEGPLDGVDFLRQLRRLDGRATPVAMVTGQYGLDDVIKHEIKLLGAHIVLKPIWIDALASLARTLLGGVKTGATLEPP